jgi:hypothetical protein
MVYWGRTPIKTNRVRYEYNRPFLEAKDYQDGDAMAVEATGYALLTMFKVEGGGVTIIQDQVNFCPALNYVNVLLFTLLIYYVKFE